MRVWKFKTSFNDLSICKTGNVNVQFVHLSYLSTHILINFSVIDVRDHFRSHVVPAILIPNRKGPIPILCLVVVSGEITADIRSWHNR